MMNNIYIQKSKFDMKINLTTKNAIKVREYD